MKQELRPNDEEFARDLAFRCIDEDREPTIDELKEVHVTAGVTRPMWLRIRTTCDYVRRMQQVAGTAKDREAIAAESEKHTAALAKAEAVVEAAEQKRRTAEQAVRLTERKSKDIENAVDGLRRSIPEYRQREIEIERSGVKSALNSIIVPLKSKISEAKVILSLDLAKQDYTDRIESHCQREGVPSVVVKGEISQPLFEAYKATLAESLPKWESELSQLYSERAKSYADIESRADELIPQ